MHTCTVCASTERYYAKGLCTRCYSRAHRKANPEMHREHDRKRWLTPERKAADKARRLRNKSKRNALCREYRRKNLSELQAYDRDRWRTPDRKRAMLEYRNENRERVRAADRAEYYRNKAKHIARVNGRRNQAKRASIELNPAAQAELYQIYAERPPGHHIDHIIPLQHPDVCGLHVPWNLQYLTATENLKKSNSFDPEDPRFKPLLSAG